MNKPLAKGFVLIPCKGEAHSNPLIDNCGACAPRWGWLAVHASTLHQAARIAQQVAMQYRGDTDAVTFNAMIAVSDELWEMAEGNRGPKAGEK